MLISILIWFSRLSLSVPRLGLFRPCGRGCACDCSSVVVHRSEEIRFFNGGDMNLGLAGCTNKGACLSVGSFACRDFDLTESVWRISAGVWFEAVSGTLFSKILAFSSTNTVVFSTGSESCLDVENAFGLERSSSLDLPFGLGVVFQSGSSMPEFACVVRCVVEALRRLFCAASNFDGLDDGDALFDVCIVSAMTWRMRENGCFHWTRLEVEMLFQVGRKCGSDDVVTQDWSALEGWGGRMVREQRCGKDVRKWRLADVYRSLRNLTTC